MAVISRSWHVPDETWQSVEISHLLVFGRGYQTWEWGQAIRSYFHPMIFVPGLYLLKLFNLDSQMLVELVPRLTQALLAALGDVSILQFNARHFGERTNHWFLIIYTTNFFLNYCSARTLVNTFEMTLTSMALNFYPTRHGQLVDRGSLIYVALISFSFMARATTAVFWLPLVLVHVYKLWKTEHLQHLFTKMIPTAVSCLVIVSCLDSFMYQKPVFIPWNFFKINIAHDISSLYGINLFYWYLSNALSALMGLAIIPFLFGCIENWNSSAPKSLFIKNVIFSVFLYSVIPHKEIRFLLPLVPVMCCIASDLLSRQSGCWRPFISDQVITALILITNIPILLYLSLVHQSGTTAVVRELSTLKSGSSVLFLMSCHPTPYYSHIHSDINLRFLTCLPNLAQVEDHVEEYLAFYDNPLDWLEKEFPEDSDITELPTHIVMFDNIQELMNKFVKFNKNYKLCGDFFHAHFIEGRIGHRVHMYCRDP